MTKNVMKMRLIETPTTMAFDEPVISSIGHVSKQTLNVFQFLFSSTDVAHQNIFRRDRKSSAPSLIQEWYSLFLYVNGKIQGALATASKVKGYVLLNGISSLFETEHFLLSTRQLNLIIEFCSSKKSVHFAFLGFVKQLNCFFVCIKYILAT